MKMKEESRKARNTLSLSPNNTAQAAIDPQLFKIVVQLTLAPSGDEILLVKSQEPADQCLHTEPALKTMPSIHWAWSQLSLQ